MVWLPDGEKNFEDIFIRFDATHERDRQTDGQTQHDGNSRAYASHRAAKTVKKHGRYLSVLLTDDLQKKCTFFSFAISTQSAEFYKIFTFNAHNPYY